MKHLINRAYFLVVLAVLFVACGTEEPNKSFIGLWEPAENAYIDLFVISSDSIKAVSCDKWQEHHQCYYKMLNDSVAELERCWLERRKQECPDCDIDESYYVEEVYMGFDKERTLIIRVFDPILDLASPDYTTLKLKRHENN